MSKVEIGPPRRRGNPGGPGRVFRVMKDPRDHAVHDPLAVAALLDDRAGPPPECAACARLHAELVAIALATARLQPPRRRRSFLIDEATASRLRRRSLRERLDALLAGGPAPGLGLATLGLALMLIGVAPSAPVADPAGPAMMSERAETLGPAPAMATGAAGAKARALGDAAEAAERPGELEAAGSPPTHGEASGPPPWPTPTGSVLLVAGLAALSRARSRRPPRSPRRG